MVSLVKSDVKYCFVSPYFWTSVTFERESDIDEFIDALRQVKLCFDDPNAHFICKMLISIKMQALRKPRSHFIQRLIAKMLTTMLTEIDMR